MVVFDVGETLVDETRHWSEWADWLGIPRFTFLAMLGSLIGSGRHHRDVFGAFGVNYQEALAARTRSGWSYEIRAEDFYPDAVPCLDALREGGHRIGIVGNQPRQCEASLQRLGLRCDLIGSSESWAVEKPSPQFFSRLIAECRLPPHEICYVGDHPEHDIGPAHRAGLRTVFVRRGPWALTLAQSDSARQADAQIDSLAALPKALQGLR